MSVSVSIPIKTGTCQFGIALPSTAQTGPVEAHLNKVRLACSCCLTALAKSQGVKIKHIMVGL